jgi:hypothetical protein
MSSIVVRISLRASSRNVWAIGLGLTLTFFYLAVPVVNALLFALALALQAVLGTAVITSVLRGVKVSLFMMCGPGLLLGGAVSFMVFQIVGRGAVGILATLLTALFGLSRFVGRSVEESSPDSVAAKLVTLGGLTALALSAEFPWLLLAAISLFGLAALTGSRTAAGRYQRGITFTLSSALLVAALFLRGRHWWLITDDYLFFEVIANHLTNSGPFAQWGSLDFSRYHWLSYGWSGLLDTIALTPDTLTTLTRVMPVVYGLAFVSSALLIIEHVVDTRDFSSVTALPAWVFVSAFQLDWSGTSTAGVMAVVLGLVALLPTMVTSNQSLARRLFVYASFGVIALLTKAPSVLTLPLLFATAEVMGSRWGRDRMKLILTTMVACMAALALLPVFESVVGGFSIEWGEQRGDDLSRSGLLNTLITLVGRSGWLIMLTCLAWWVWFAGVRNRPDSRSSLAILALSPAILVAVAMDALVVGISNTNEYFSGPFYLVALLPLLTMVPDLRFQTSTQNALRLPLVWASLAGVSAGSALVFKSIPLPPIAGAGVASSLLADGRVLLGVIILVAVLSKVCRPSEIITLPVIALFIVIIAWGIAPTVSGILKDGISPSYSVTELNSLTGPPDAHTAGEWLKKNSRQDAIMATNSLRTKEGDLGGDFSLAAWSGREFLVMGPSLSFDSLSTSNAIELSESFATQPSTSSARQLAELGVEWFVVDLDKTTLRDWEPYAETTAMTWRFWILRLR